MKKFKQITTYLISPILAGAGAGVAIASIITNNTNAGIIGGAVMVIGWVCMKVMVKHAK